MEEDASKPYPPEDFALPPQSHRLQHFFIFVLVVCVLSVVVGLVMYVNISKQRMIAREEVVLLTESEVYEYRNLLRTDTVSYVLPEIEFDAEGTVQAQSVTPLYNFETPNSVTTRMPSMVVEQHSVTNDTIPPSAPIALPQGENNPPQRTSSMGTTPIPLPDSLKPKSVPQVQASIVTSSGQEAGSGSDEVSGGEKMRFEVQGIAFIISPEYGYLTLLDRVRNREYTILVTSDTDISLLGGRIALSAIKAGDTLYVTGEGYEDSGRIHATSIAVTAQEELIIITS